MTVELEEVYEGPENTGAIGFQKVGVKTEDRKASEEDVQTLFRRFGIDIQDGPEYEEPDPQPVTSQKDLCEVILNMRFDELLTFARVIKTMNKDNPDYVVAEIAAYLHDHATDYLEEYE